MSWEEVLRFWFAPETSRHWFRSTPELDALIRERFEPTWWQARAGTLAHWENDAAGSLALVIVLDQLPLNIFRDQPEGYATEALAREVAGRAIERGLDALLDDGQKAFLYLPYMHSEDLSDQERSVALFEAAELTDNLPWARHHCDIVRRFGRFPHRNAVLGRVSTPEEEAWLASSEAYRP